MTSKTLQRLLLVGAVIAVAACSRTNSTGAGGTAATETKSSETAKAGDPVTSAESAAPAALAHNASIMTADASGAMKTVRQGSNGWTCIPDDPNTPGTDPMCMDGNAAKFIQAMMAHK